MNNRLPYIDILKTIGLLLVILAHVESPILLKQIRSFDVCLLVIVSGYLSGRGSFDGQGLDFNAIRTYIKKRVERIVVPAWIFILIFLPIQAVLYEVPTIKELVLTFTFQRDCGLLGYLWIIWVFFVCACIIPFIARMNTKPLSIILWLIVLLLSEVLIAKTNLEENRILYCTVFTILPYGFLTFLGYHLDSLKTYKSAIIAGSVFAICGYLLYVHYNKFILIGSYKYPARLYYLSYGICVSLFLFELMKKCPPPTLYGLICDVCKYSYFVDLLLAYFVFVWIAVCNAKCEMVAYIFCCVISIHLDYIYSK